MLLPLVAAGALFLARQWERQTDEALSRLLGQAQALQVAVDRELALDQAVLQTLASLPDIDNGDWARFHAAAVRAASVRPGSVVTVFAPDGRNLVNSSLPFGTPLPNVRQRPVETDVAWRDRRIPLPDLALFTEPFETGRPKVSGLIWGRISRRPVVATQLPVLRQGRAVYVLGLSYGADVYGRLLAAIDGTHQYSIGLVDAQGLVVARSPGHDVHVGRRAPNRFGQGTAALPLLGTGEGVNLDGVSVFFAHSRSERSDWAIVVALPRQQVLAPAWQTLWVSLGVLALATLIGLVVATRHARRIAAALGGLARQAAEGPEGGDPAVAVRPAGVAEVDRLALALQAAAEHQRVRLQVERDREQAREDLRQANARLTEADRQKDEFLGMLSHELRNPLGPIRTALHVLDRTDPTGPQSEEARATIKRQVQHMARLVDDLLDVTRIARGKLELRLGDVDLVALVRGVVQDYGGLFSPRGIGLTSQLGDGPLWVRCDATRIAQVVGNLLHNAAKFTPAGGTVALTLRADGGHAVIEVADSGVGIEAALLPAVFQPFVQAAQGLARTQGGLGLGLALVRGIVDLHGGSVVAVSRGCGLGSRFTVHLPLMARPPQAEPVERRQRPLRSRARRSVLLVEDNDDAAQSMAALVGLLGHDVTVAHDGAAAVDAFRADRFDAVLCDIGLPGMTGFEVAGRLRALGGPELLLVALTGYAGPDDVQHARDAGFDLHLAKPVDPDRIAALLGDASVPGSLHSTA